MNNKFRIIIEYAWMAVLAMAIVALVLSVTRGDTRNTLAFSVIALISLVMFLFRRSQRKKS